MINSFLALYTSTLSQVKQPTRHIFLHPLSTKTTTTKKLKFITLFSLEFKEAQHKLKRRSTNSFHCRHPPTTSSSEMWSEKSFDGIREKKFSIKRESEIPLVVVMMMMGGKMMIETTEKKKNFCSRDFFVGKI